MTTYLCQAGMVAVCQLVERCPVCLTVPRSPARVLQCTAGHQFCSTCRPGLSACPQCRVSLAGPDIRCLAAERIVRLAAEQ